MNIEAIERILQEPDGSEKLYKSVRPADALPGAYALFTGGSAAACAYLCRLVKQDVYRDKLNDMLGEAREPLQNAIAAPDPKLRKNAARLAGALGKAGDAPALIERLRAEDMRYVRPSVILALGSIGTAEALWALEGYTPTPAQTPAETRHYNDELAALSSVFAKRRELPHHGFLGLGSPRELELRTPYLLADPAFDAVIDMGLKPHAKSPESFRVSTADVAALFEIRSFSELLFVVASRVKLNAASIAAAAAPYLRALLVEACGGEREYGYRIEIRTKDASVHADRGKLSREIAAAITTQGTGKENAALINSTGDYEAELRVELESPETVSLYVKLYVIPDERFSYRLGDVPASMQPSLAAAMLEMASEHLKTNARVIDPCCGSGTFLIERERLAPCSALTGVDISHKAVEIARGNAAAAGSNARFIVNDCARFSANRRYDELISNLPFGNRTGSHEDNEALYATILDKLHEWLVPGGTAILYTMEFTLLKRLLKTRTKLELASFTRTSAGGLAPGIFVIKVK